MDIDGEWTVTLNSPMGAQELRLTLASAGGGLTGSIKGGPMGELEIEDGVIEDDHLEWTSRLTTPVELTLDWLAEIDGDTMSGSVRLGAMGNAELTGTRV